MGINRTHKDGEKKLKEYALNNHYKVPSGCWFWAGSFDRNGYGNARWLGKSISAHRLIYLLVHGEIPEGLDVMHSCDMRSCVNPAHLILGTRKQNMEDAAKKGRCTSKPRLALRY